MIGEAAFYVANRVTNSAVASISRTVIWGATLAVLLIGAAAFALIALYSHLAPMFGSTEAAGIIASGCLAAGLLLVIVPAIWKRFRSAAELEPTIATAPLEAVDSEARELVVT